MLGSLFESSKDNVVITDAHARVVYMNPSLLKTINLTLAQAQGRTAVENFKGNVVMRRCFNATQQVIATGKPKTLLLTSPKQTFNRALYDVVNISPIVSGDNRVIGAITIGRESTQD